MDGIAEFAMLYWKAPGGVCLAENDHRRLTDFRVRFPAGVAIYSVGLGEPWFGKVRRPSLRFCGIAATTGGIFAIIHADLSIRALIGSRETWKISYVRAGKGGNAPLGAFSSASRTGLFQGLS